MLCKTFDVNKLKPGRYVVQEKVDGIRCFVRVYPRVGKVDFFTRNGKPITTVDHLKDDLLKIATPLAKYPLLTRSSTNPSNLTEIWLDGELFLNNFKETVSAVKRKEPSEQSEQVKFILLDYFVPNEDGIFSLAWVHRTGKLWTLIDHECKSIVYPAEVASFCISPDEPIDWEIAESFLNSILEDNPDWEGLVIKNDESPYIFNKRSDDWLKLKKERTADLAIIEVVEGKGKHEGRTGAIIAADENGNTVRVGTGFNDEEREYVWKNKETLKGKIIEVSYMERTEGGSYRFPVFKHFRFDKDFN